VNRNMRRRASIFGTLAVVAILAIDPRVVCRMVSSARNVERCFHELRSTEGSFSPIERLVFSLVLANTKTTPPEAHTDASALPRS
jgi:hypothetical protein